MVPSIIQYLITLALCLRSVDHARAHGQTTKMETQFERQHTRLHLTRLPNYVRLPIPLTKKKQNGQLNINDRVQFTLVYGWPHKSLITIINALPIAAIVNKGKKYNGKLRLYDALMVLTFKPYVVFG